MKNHIFLYFVFFLNVLLTSCTSLRESSKFEFQSSKYYTSLIPKADNKVYLDVEEDSIRVFPVETKEGAERVIKPPKEIFTASSYRSNGTNTFYNPSFDLDILTVPLKYRPGEQNVPNQLTTNFNGNLYLGFRNDIFRIHYERSPVNEVERKIRHFGFSLGGFAGLSSEPVNPWVTGEVVDLEYDVVVFSTGAAVIMGFNNVTGGIVYGFDYLLDSNRNHWIYQGQPWLRLAFGINLN